MAISKCPRCQKSYFETVVQSPKNSNYKLIFVQCQSCQSVVGVLDYYNIGTLAKDIEKKVDSLSSQIRNISNVNSNLNIINNNILEIKQLIQKLK